MKLKLYPKLRTSILLILLITSLPSYAWEKDSINSSEGRHPQWGVGVKFHNPGGITLKKYFGNKAIEFQAGRISPWNHNAYYYFNHHPDFKNKDMIYEGYEPVYRPVVFKLHYLKHTSSKMFPGLSWYWGVGVQSRLYSYYFDYSYSNGITTISQRERVDGVGVGADGIAGLEYTFRAIPFSLFFEGEVYLEAVNHPLLMKVNTGTGIRYTF